MAKVVTIGYTWPSAGQFTSTNMNNSVNEATFAATAVDDTTMTLVTIGGHGRLRVKDGGITTGKLASDAVTPTKIDRDAGEFFLDDVTASTTKLTPYTETISSSTMALDLDNGNFQIITFDTNTTTVSALDNLESGKQFTILIVHSGAVSIADTAWDSTWKWQGGVAPSSTGTDGAVDIISGVTDGTNAYVTYIKNFS